jgi:hypothetical protein
MSKVNAYLLSHRADNDIWFAPRITCADGFTLSVQVHSGAYCSPRDGIGPDWTSAEIGFPSDTPTPEVMAYAEEPDCPTQTVYGYVPIELIDALIDAHGGFAGEGA